MVETNPELLSYAGQANNIMILVGNKLSLFKEKSRERKENHINVPEQQLVLQRQQPDSSSIVPSSVLFAIVDTQII